jgi:hypothetical protein
MSFLLAEVPLTFRLREVLLYCQISVYIVAKKSTRSIIIHENDTALNFE